MQVLRNLGDRNYEKRKQAALEIEHLIKEINSQSGDNPKDSIHQIIRVLVKDYAFSTQSNHRKVRINFMYANQNGLIFIHECGPA